MLSSGGDAQSWESGLNTNPDSFSSAGGQFYLFFFLKEIILWI